MRHRMLFLTLLVAIPLILVGCGSESVDSKLVLGPNGEISGTLLVDSGACDDLGTVSGSWFRMVEPGGNVVTGPFITNYDSICSDQTYSLLTNGSIGLKSNVFQVHPNPAFDAATNGLAKEIFQPVQFYSVDFAVSTELIHPETGELLKPPRFFVERSQDESKPNTGRLTANLSSLFIAWNGEFFEQGSPHPEGFIGATTTPFGSINLESRRFTLQWTSQVVGGAFDGFIGEWQLTGMLTPNN